MKIAYFINQYPKVSHTFIRREILALERRDFEVHRVALRGWSETPPDPTDLTERSKTHYVLRQGLFGLLAPVISISLIAPLAMIQVMRLALSVSWQSDRRLAVHLVRVAEACRLVGWLRKFGVRWLHAHFGTNSAEVAMYARLLGGPPYSFTVHGPEEFESPMAIGSKVAAAAFVAAISSFGRSQLYLRCQPRDWGKIHIIRCGLDAAFCAPEPPMCAPRLVCVGRLCAAKGQVLLIEALARLRRQGTRVELVLAGDGELRGEIEAAVARHDLAEQVRITGWISSDAVRAEILAARALVLPSFAEGLPVVIMEAMGLGRPVLTTFVAGIPELVVPGITGWLVPAGSIEDLVEAMQDCLSSSAERLRRMGEAGHARVLERHSIDIEAKKLGDLFLSRGLADSQAA